MGILFANPCGVVKEFLELFVFLLGGVREFVKVAVGVSRFAVIVIAKTSKNGRSPLASFSSVNCMRE